MSDEERRRHLLRGAPGVRGWSKYQQTVRDWTLCGIHLIDGSKGTLRTENADEVTCRFCRQLMGVVGKTARAGL